MQTRITFGADPEFFLINANNQAVPVCGWLGGAKGEPVGLRDGMGILEDGVAAEINIRPSTDPYEMTDNCYRAMVRACSYANDRPLRPSNVSQSPRTSEWFASAALDQAGPMARVFGCAPDYDAYRQGAETDKVDIRTLIQGPQEVRFAGGHVHVGYKGRRPDVPEDAVALLCDLLIGAPLVRYGERQDRRRAHYGQPGRFRPTSYGVEYRTPSGAWLHNSTLRACVAGGLERLRVVLEKPSHEIREIWNRVPWKDVQESIATETPVADDFGVTL